MAQHLALGAQGEELAASFLSAAGMAIIARNWRCRSGEIDVIAEDGGMTAFVEVKTRRGLSCGRPEEAVTPLKQQRIRNAAHVWLREHRGPWRDVRFDVVAIMLRPGRAPEIRHLKAVF
ncbi:YraN family protein [Nocardia sp. CDC160]|uniref:YraN family protein n=1 Tax=Nocardia sp. CDC160 TaxID=3112166 RepID=UPI002DB95923|nr:YraN family protein [Nocardia sp. CDC160]MEC3914998.1 YraN family protein [Nocardia sp. CDC160]